MNTIKRLWQQVTSRPPEYPIEVRNLIARLVDLQDHEDTSVWATARSLLRTWDHDRSVK